MRSGLSRLSRRAAHTRALATETGAGGTIDVHTHVFLPRYMKMLRERTSVPRVISAAGEDRLIILPGEDEEASTSAGRPIGSEYHDMDRKLRFMDNHGIAASVLSLANPWLDFLTRDEAVDMATALNDDMEAACAASGGRFYGFGVLPIVQDPEASAAEARRIAQMPHIRGIILSTAGRGPGLDDRSLDPVWEAMEETGQMMFVHPHYGVGTEHFTGTGHAMFLALGFTFETTVAVTRLVLGGVMDRHPALNFLLAHSGGTLPFLAGRLDSCYEHDHALAGTLKHNPSHYLKRMYYDSIQYQTPSLDCVSQFAGNDRLMFGTDNPFFPPPGVPMADIDNHPWPSTVKNYEILNDLPDQVAHDILQGNAARILNIPV